MLHTAEQCSISSYREALVTQAKEANFHCRHVGFKSSCILREFLASSLQKDVNLHLGHQQRSATVVCYNVRTE